MRRLLYTKANPLANLRNRCVSVELVIIQLLSIISLLTVCMASDITSCTYKHTHTMTVRKRNERNICVLARRDQKSTLQLLWEMIFSSKVTSRLVQRNFLVGEVVLSPRSDQCQEALETLAPETMREKNDAKRTYCMSDPESWPSHQSPIFICSIFR